MSEYWKQHYRRAVSAHPLSPLKQTGKTVNGSEVGAEQLTIIIAQIKNQLGLNKSDSLVDLGCGNGLLTARISRIVNKVTAVDFTDGFLVYAQNHNNPQNITYLHSDILSIEEKVLVGVTALLMYEVIQHLSYDEFCRLISNLAILKPGARFFIGGIPNKEKIRSFYNSNDKYEYYLKCEREQQPHLGRWWTESEVREVAENSGWIMHYVAQPDILYTSYYRFDAVLVKV